jgi:segregation and condensation protein A
LEYKVKLERFEGPLDLLLFLIKKEEINIYDIPIAQITQQYLDYIRMMEFLNLELAGEFLVVAATLMRIKARMLLPRQEDELGEEDDPRRELVQQLLEYQKFKQAASELETMEYQRRLLFTRPEPVVAESLPELERTYGLFDLICAFRQVLERGEVRYMEVRAEEVSIEEKIEFLRRRIEEAEVIAFGDLFDVRSSRAELVVTFLALLEILRLGVATVRQTKAFGEIWIHRAGAGPADPPESGPTDQTDRAADGGAVERIDGGD